jgi:hypothetical protein
MRRRPEFLFSAPVGPVFSHVAEAGRCYTLAENSEGKHVSEIQSPSLHRRRHGSCRDAFPRALEPAIGCKGANALYSARIAGLDGEWASARLAASLNWKRGMLEKGLGRQAGT